jgi:DNA-binding transcriptional regulator YbjK
MGRPTKIENPKGKIKTGIIDAALQVITEQGLAALTYRNVAAQAQVSLGTVTYYFNTMEELVSTAQNRLTDTITKTYMNAMLQASNKAEAQQTLAKLLSNNHCNDSDASTIPVEIYNYSRLPGETHPAQPWLVKIQQTLERHFDEESSDLSIIIAGLTLHNRLGNSTFSQSEILELIKRNS